MASDPKEDNSGKKHRGREQFYIGRNDFELFQHFNEEFIEDIVEVPVGYYRVAPKETEVNIYGESKDGRKIYEQPLRLYTIIDPSDQETAEDDFTFDVNRDVTFGFQRERLKEFNIYPERGDIIEFDHDYYEVNSVVDNELLGSQWFFRQSVVVQTHVARSTNITLIDPETQEIKETNVQPGEFEF